MVNHGATNLLGKWCKAHFRTFQIQKMTQIIHCFLGEFLKHQKRLLSLTKLIFFQVDHTWCFD